MTTTAQNHYKLDLRELQFVLLEQFRLGELLGKPPFADWDEDAVKMALAESYRFVSEFLGPCNAAGDRVGCRLEEGQVKTAPGFREAWQAMYEQGWKGIAEPPEHGGQGAPHCLALAVEEMHAGANIAFSMYPGLTYGAAELIDACGTDEQKARYLDGMYRGRLGGTMCLTEAHAGSDVGLARTRATPIEGSRYAIQGTKIFISSGDHDLADNIVHLVLARIDGASPGTKGLSLFIVPKRRLNADGSPGEWNDVTVGSLEHKMGIVGSSTCVLNFGDHGGCVGELVGGVPHQGMAQMFLMMNYARLGVGVQGLGVASTAYLNAFHYARERLQGAAIERWKDPQAPRVPILDHADVRRMLLDMKARVEGIRALAVKVAMHRDRMVVRSGDPGYHQGQIELLTPVVKAYASDQSFRICETAIQVMGGAGYTKDYGVEQYCRDSKIFSIYEGTNHIQAMDLVSRKLPQHGGANLMAFLGDVRRFIGAHGEHPELGGAVALLDQAQAAFADTAMRLMTWSQSGRLRLVPLAANRVLQMLSETVVAWQLLDGAVIAERRLRELEAGHPDQPFYAGKRAAALYFARNVLPGVQLTAQILAAEDDTALTIPDAAFAAI